MKSGRVFCAAAVGAALTLTLALGEAHGQIRLPSERAVDRGWPVELTNGLVDGLSDFPAVDRSYLFFLAIAPDPALDFRSPNHLKASVQNLLPRANALYGGHMVVGWQCSSRNHFIRGASGLTGESQNQTRKLLDTGWGLNAFLATFTDGRLQSIGEIDEAYRREVIHRRRDFGLVILEVESSSCLKAVDFVRTFAHHRDQPWSRFSPLLDPQRFEGGGCLSYGHAVLAASGAWTPILIDWWRTLEVDARLLGQGPVSRSGAPLEGRAGPEIPWTSPQTLLKPETASTLSLNSLLNLDWSHSPSGRALRFRHIDPELVQLTIQELALQADTFLGDGHGRGLNRRRRLTGVHLAAGETGTDFVRATPVVPGYDAEFGGASLRLTERLHVWRETLRRTHRIQVFPLAHRYGLIIERAQAGRR